jgi:hypothetical protein
MYPSRRSNFKTTTAFEDNTIEENMPNRILWSTFIEDHLILNWRKEKRKAPVHEEIRKQKLLDMEEDWGKSTSDISDWDSIKILEKACTFEKERAATLVDIGNLHWKRDGQILNNFHFAKNQLQIQQRGGSSFFIFLLRFLIVEFPDINTRRWATSLEYLLSMKISPIFHNISKKLLTENLTKKNDMNDVTCYDLVDLFLSRTWNSRSKSGGQPSQLT